MSFYPSPSSFFPLVQFFSLQSRAPAFMIFIFQNPWVREDTWWLHFWFWLSSHVVSQFIHLPSNGRTFLLYDWITFCCIYTAHFLFPFVSNDYQDWFHRSVVVNKIRISKCLLVTLLQVNSRVSISSCLGILMLPGINYQISKTSIPLSLELLSYTCFSLHWIHIVHP